MGDPFSISFPIFSFYSLSYAQNHKKSYFSNFVISLNFQYPYFIDNRLNDADPWNTIRNKLFLSIKSVNIGNIFYNHNQHVMCIDNLIAKSSRSLPRSTRFHALIKSLIETLFSRTIEAATAFYEQKCTLLLLLPSFVLFYCIFLLSFAIAFTIETWLFGWLLCFVLFCFCYPKRFNSKAIKN